MYLVVFIFEVVAASAATLLLALLCVKHPKFSYFKINPIDVLEFGVDCVDLRLQKSNEKGVKLMMLFLAIAFPFTIFIYGINEDVLTILLWVSLLIFCYGFDAPIKVIDPETPTLSFTTQFVSRDSFLTVHLANYDDTFTRKTYRDLESVLCNTKKMNVNAIEMTSPLFSKIDDSRGFGFLEKIAKKHGYMITTKELQWFEKIPSRLMFFFMTRLSKAESLKKVGNKWITIYFTKTA
ncbi:hypothetical protein ACTTZI_004185 [Vibrio vulnificus]